MDRPDAEKNTLRPLRGALLLGGTTVLAVGLLALVHEATRERIEQVERARRMQAVEQVLDGVRHDNDLLLDAVTVTDRDLLGTSAPVTVYRATLDGEPVAAVLAPTAPDGYSGSIRLLVGIDVDGRLLGVRVQSHRETPGLGDLIEARKSDWILKFTGRSLGDPPLERWKVRKDGGDFDQFTGATVTPRAVVAAVANALLYFERERERIFPPSATPADEPIDQSARGPRIG
jgi:electron transport complex protein RnfG